MALPEEGIGSHAMMRMTLKQRFLLHNLLLVGGMLGAGAIVAGRLREVSRDVNLSHSIYGELRTVGSVAVDVGTARGLLSDPTANRAQIVGHLTYAVGGLNQFVNVAQGYGTGGDTAMAAAYVPINGWAGTARDYLQEVVDRLDAQKPPSEKDAEAHRKAVEAALTDIDKMASSCIGIISTRQQSASSDFTKSMVLIGIFSTAALIAATGLSILQYRLVMIPLQRLRRSVRKVAESAIRP